MSASDDLQDGLAEAFDTLSDEFESGVTVKLLKVAADGTNAFTVIATIADKRFFEYSNYRKNFLLEIADTGTQLTSDVQAATHVKIDSEVYVIRLADTLAPSGTNPVWTIFCDLFEERSHYVTL